MPCSAILLAAGRSTRMGTMKGLLPWQGTTLFEYQLQMLQKSVISEIIVIVGYQAETFIHIAKNYPVKVLYNEHYHIGKCSSILTGLHELHHTRESILITSVDQPAEAETINKLDKALNNSESHIAIPVYKGQRGHPVLFSGSLLGELLTIKEETKGLRSVIQNCDNKIAEIEINSPSIQLNLNTPEEYQNARRRFTHANFRN